MNRAMSTVYFSSPFDSRPSPLTTNLCLSTLPVHRTTRLLLITAVFWRGGRERKERRNRRARLKVPHSAGQDEQIGVGWQPSKSLGMSIGLPQQPPSMRRVKLTGALDKAKANIVYTPIIAVHNPQAARPHPLDNTCELANEMLTKETPSQPKKASFALPIISMDRQHTRPRNHNSSVSVLYQSCVA